MKLIEIISVMKYLSGESSLSKKELYRYDLNKDGIVDPEDFISMFELYSTNNNEVKNSYAGKEFRIQIKKMLKSGKFSADEKNYIGEQISSIAEKNIIEIRATDNMVKTEKGKEEIIK